MKKTLLAICIFMLSVGTLFASLNYTFDAAADTTGWETGWNNWPAGPGNGVIAPLAISASGQHAGAGCLMVTLTSDTSPKQNQIFIQINNIGPSLTSSDTILSAWCMISTGLTPALAEGGTLYAQDANWGWEANYPWIQGTWAKFTLKLAGVQPYNRVGMQLQIDNTNTAVPPVIWLIDDITVDSGVLPVNDWTLY